MRRGTLLALLVGCLWVFPSCSGGDDMTDGGDSASDAPQDTKSDSPTSNAVDSAAE
jgi:hypothetical protein